MSSVKAGLDSVRIAMQKWEPTSAEDDELSPQNKNYLHLFCGDESYGVISILFTGNIKDGYTLKYEYQRDGNLVEDLTEEVKKDFHREGWEEDKIHQELFEAVKFLNEYTDPLNPGEILNVEGPGYELIKELMSK